MDAIKLAFSKAKQDISELRESIDLLKSELMNLRIDISLLRQTDKPTDKQTFPHTTFNNSSFTAQNPTDKLNEPINLPLYGLKTSNNSFSIGNEGVPTDKQTNQQTNRHTTNIRNIDDKSRLEEIQKVSELLDSLNELKNEVRFKFKGLTKQEMLVFSTLYQLEDQQKTPVSYPQLALKLGLSESSIRDYTQRMIKKGIPIIKTKENNKKIYLSVAPELKKIASLSTIMSFRDSF